MTTSAVIAQALRSSGWCLLPGYLDADRCAALRADLQAHRDQLCLAGIGRGGVHQQQPAIRSDETLWLTGATPPQRQLLETMEALRFELNRELLLGLFDYEAHYARYVPGAFYRRHVDAFRGQSNRVLSTVFYLNAGWQAADGGELLLWPEQGEQLLARVLPEEGTALFFLSEEFPHEVRPARRERLSIAGWFRINTSQAKRVDPPV